MKRAKQTLARLPHPDASSTITSAPLAPAPPGTTPTPSPRITDTSRSRTPPPDRPRPIGMHPGVRARIQFRRFPGGEEKEVRPLYQAGQ